MAIKHHTVPPIGTIGAVGQPQWAEAHDVDANTITNSMLAQSPANTIKGNNTGVPGNVLDLTLPQILSLLTIPAGTDTQVQFNSGGALTGSAKLTWNDSTLVLTIGAPNSATLIRPPVSPTGGGGGFSMKGGDAQQANQGGGSFSLSGGIATGTGMGGELFLAGGASSNVNGAGGIVAINGGAAATGGPVNITGGASTGANAGGGLALTGGPAGATGSGGSITITGSNSGGGAFGAGITVPGAAQSGTSSDLVIFGAGASAATAGKVALQSFNVDNSLFVDGFGNVVSPCLTASVPAIGDTNGFFYIVKVAGAPTGVPANLTGASYYANAAPFRYDTTNHKLWVYDGAWKGVVLS